MRKRTRSPIRWWALLAVMALVAAACTGTGTDDTTTTGDDAGTGQAATALPPGEIKVGEVVAHTGAVASFGAATHNGTLLAVEEINASGMLGEGVMIRLIDVDDQSTPTGAATAAKKLISEDNVVAILGEVASKNSLAIAPIAGIRRRRWPAL